MPRPLPSLRKHFVAGIELPPRIVVLEVFKPDAPMTEPVAWVMVEREETESGGEVRLELFLRRIVTDGNFEFSGSESFVGSYNRNASLVRLSHGMTTMDLLGLEGHRIGTYLMTQIVQWAKQWPDARVASIELIDGQASDENRERRNHFWERYGLRFAFTDPSNRAGRSKAMRVADLYAVESWTQNINAHALDALVSRLLCEKERAEANARGLEEYARELGAETARLKAHPLRRVFSALWRRK